MSGVHGGDLGLAGAFDHAGHLVGLAAGAGEDHHGVVVGLLEQGEEQLVALVDGDGVERVGDGGGDFAAGDLDLHRIDQAPLCEGLDRGGHGGGEEKCLAAFPWAEIDDFAHLREEPHVEHAVDLIEDENLDFPEAHGGAVEAIDEAAGSGDHDIHAFLELLHLLAEADAAVEKGDLHPGLGSVFFKLLGDLVGEFTGRLEDEDLGFSQLLDFRKRGQCERRGFASACLGCADDVLALEDDRDRLRLDRGRVGVARFQNCFKNGGGEAECVKSHEGRVYAGFSAWSRTDQGGTSNSERSTLNIERRLRE